MIERSIQINEKIGFHARTAAVFAKLAGNFDSKIEIGFREKAVNGKSMLAIMTLGVKSGDFFTLSANGTDEEVAMSELANLVESNFNFE